MRASAGRGDYQLRQVVLTSPVRTCCIRPSAICSTDEILNNAARSCVPQAPLPHEHSPWMFTCWWCTARKPRRSPMKRTACGSSAGAAPRQPEAMTCRIGALSAVRFVLDPIVAIPIRSRSSPASRRPPIWFPESARPTVPATGDKYQDRHWPTASFDLAWTTAQCAAPVNMPSRCADLEG